MGGRLPLHRCERLKSMGFRFFFLIQNPTIFRMGFPIPDVEQIERLGTNAAVKADLGIVLTDADRAGLSTEMAEIIPSQVYALVAQQKLAKPVGSIRC